MSILIPAWLVKLALVLLGGFLTFVGRVIAMQSGWAGQKTYIYIGIPISIAGISTFIYGVVS